MSTVSSPRIAGSEPGRSRSIDWDRTDRLIGTGSGLTAAVGTLQDSASGRASGWPGRARPACCATPFRRSRRWPADPAAPGAANPSDVAGSSRRPFAPAVLRPRTTRPCCHQFRPAPFRQRGVAPASSAVEISCSVQAARPSRNADAGSCRRGRDAGSQSSMCRPVATVTLPFRQSV